MAVRTVYVSEGRSPSVTLKDRKRSFRRKTTITRCGIRETATRRNFVFVAVFKQPRRGLG
jgi:hypothetical protein